MPKTGRNDPCPCGSGKKYKRCCLEKDEAAASAAREAAGASAAASPLRAIGSVSLGDVEELTECRLPRCSAVHRPILLDLIPQPTGGAGGAAQ